MKIRYGNLNEKEAQALQETIAPLVDLLRCYSLLSIKAGIISEDPISHLRNSLCILETVYHHHVCPNCQGAPAELMDKIRRHMDS